MKSTKKPVGCVPLETLDAPVIQAAPEADPAKAKFVHLKIEDSTAVTEFSKQAKAEKDAKKAKETQKAKFEQQAIRALFLHNITNPTEPLVTVKVTDDGDGCVNVSFKDQYADLPRDPALKVLTQLGVRNPNKFVTEHMLVGFNTGIFYGADGMFRTELFNDVVEALQEVADRHDVDLPISSTKVLRVKPDFHKERWTIGNNEADQETLTETYKNTVSFTPVVA